MLSINRFGSLVLAGLCVYALASPASAQLIQHKDLSASMALTIAETTIATCKTNGYNVSVTVVGRNGEIIVQVRGDNTGPHTIENSMRKAYTAFTTRNSTAEMAKRAQPGLSGFMLLDKITPIEGGLPIFAGKDLVGSVGISGAPGGEKDAACAQVGIDKIAKGLAG